jgi:outer membrane protein
MRVVCRMVMAGSLLLAVASEVGAQVTPPAPVAATVLKIAYLNSNQVLEGAPGRAEALAQFEKETLPLRTQMQRMSDSLQAIITEYQKAAAQLTPAQRSAKEASIGAKQQDYQQRAQEMQQSAQARQEVLMAPVMEQVNKVIQDVRAEDGYAFIFDSGAQVPFIVSADKNLDITSRIIDRLKSLGPPKLPAPSVVGPAAAGPVKPPTTGPVATPAGVTRPTRP